MDRRIGNTAPAGRRGHLLDADREASLRARLVERDQAALAELVEAAGPWLLNVARSMLYDEDEAEEVVMEAFRTMWQNVTPAAGEQGPLMPYLIRVTRHRAIDRLRARRRHKRKLTSVSIVSEAGGVPPPEPDEAGSPGWRVHARVHSALDELPADQRAVIRLAYFGGLTQSEVAAELRIPLGTVKTRLRLAMVRLRGALAGLEDWLA